MNRLTRNLTIVLLIVTLAATVTPIAAQESLPDAEPSLLDGLDLPTLEVTVTGAGIVARVRAPSALVPWATHPETGTVLYTESATNDGLVQWGTHPETGTALYTDAPDSLFAGSLVVDARNETDGAVTIVFAQLSAGTSVEDVLASAGSAAGRAADLVIAGGVELGAGATGRFVVHFDAGEYVIFTDGGAEIASPATTLVVSDQLPEGAAG